ncbi:MAG: serine hydrolase [Ignavibacteria bacterium]|nr:serine hydrolase [Ignavibacteria bacterium]
MKLSILILFYLLLLTSNVFAQEIKTFDEKKILSFIEKFNDKDQFVNGEAINKLVKIGEPAVEYLIKSLQDENDNVRWCSAIALEKISPSGKQAIPLLTKALQDKNSNVRWCSTLALGNYKSDAASSIPELQKLLNDEDYDVRWAAYISLSKIDKNSLNIVPDFAYVINNLETLTPQLMKELKVPGVSISVIKNKVIAWSKSFGVSDASLQNEVTNKTIFEACSMSKPVFAYLVLKLVEIGKLELDKPLFGYLPEEFVCEDENYPKQITARMILSHTSGLPNWRKGGEEIGAPLSIYFKPGTKFNYSGEGIFYLQRVVEHITQEPLESFAKRTLFDKLGLESTSFVWTKNLNPQISTGHDASENCNERSKYLHSNAAYTLYTTSDEYAKFIIEILKTNNGSEHSLSDQMTKEMLTHQVRVDTRDVIDRPGRNLGLQGFRGLGWAIDSTISGDVIYHSGANQTGFRCYSQFSPKNASGIVIMTNGENGSELWQRLIKVVGNL